MGSHFHAVLGMTVHRQQADGPWVPRQRGGRVQAGVAGAEENVWRRMVVMVAQQCECLHAADCVLING